MTKYLSTIAYAWLAFGSTSVLADCAYGSQCARLLKGAGPCGSPNLQDVASYVPTVDSFCYNYDYFDAIQIRGNRKGYGAPYAGFVRCTIYKDDKCQNEAFKTGWQLSEKCFYYSVGKSVSCEWDGGT